MAVMKLVRILLAISLLVAMAAPVHADQASAAAAMEDEQNPLFLLNTSAGEIYLELFPNEAPDNVGNFIALAEGNVEIIDSDTGTVFRPRYYDGMRFHRVIPGFVIQAGSPWHNPLGAPDELLDDEINADFLGLNRELLLNPDGSFNELLNIASQEDFAERILKPLYERMNIDSANELLERQYQVLEELQEMTVKEAYENLGYRYQSGNPSRSIVRGTLALANSGPDSNGPEFFIALSDADWLSGRHTVIGNVVEGLEVVDQIGLTAVDPQLSSRRSAVIYSLRRLN